VVRGKNLDEFPEKDALNNCFGPFPHGLQLREAMKLIRKIFPYRDTCTPAEEMIAAGKRPKSCFNHHIGLCPGVCTGEVSKQSIADWSASHRAPLSGQKEAALKTLEREMKLAAKEERFEEAHACARRCLRSQSYPGCLAY
jgi:excinuclease ABC subunit C